MSIVLVAAPHPDDETLGCGGTIVRHVADGDEVHWMIATDMSGPEYSPARAGAREREIDAVAAHYGFAGVHRLGFPAATLDAVPMAERVAAVSQVVRAVAPATVYLPSPGDAHSDHAALFEAAQACTKWFRYPSVRRVRIFETLSETGFCLDPRVAVFRPNLFVDISGHLDAKLAALAIYAGETGEHPFPRSAHAVRALADLRGTAAGVAHAEAFESVREVV